MRKLLTKRSHIIAAGQAVSGIAAYPQTLHVICGQVWITVEGVAGDHWLSAGESLLVAPKRLVVIEADKVDSRVEIPGASKRRGLGSFSRARALAPWLTAGKLPAR